MCFNLIVTAVPKSLASAEYRATPGGVTLFKLSVGWALMVSVNLKAEVSPAFKLSSVFQHPASTHCNCHSNEKLEIVESSSFFNHFTASILTLKLTVWVSRAGPDTLFKFSRRANMNTHLIMMAD